MTAAFLIAGLVLLVAGADLLVRGASRLALALRIPPVIVGLTVVAFGTSAPELAVSVSAALSGQSDIALGNVVGSNVFNVLLILGLSALVAPLRVSARLIRIDVPVMIGASLLVLLLAWDGAITRVDGLALLAVLLTYLGYLFHAGVRGGQAVDVPAAGPRGRGGLAFDAALVAVGLVLLVVGSRWLVASARDIAAALGVSELIVGLTVVAAGTSLPELATSVMATARGERDIAVGNVVGSNIFNLVAILGIAATVAPAGLVAPPAVVTFDLPVMTAVALVCLPVFFSGGVIARWEGAVLVGYYIAYTTYIALDASGHAALPAFRDAMLYFVLPLTLVTLVAVIRPGPRDGAGSRERRGPGP